MVNVGELSDDKEVDKETGMVVSGDILENILEDKTFQKRWMKMAIQCKAVIICR